MAESLRVPDGESDGVSGACPDSAFAKVLNSHGYGFHYSILNLAHDLRLERLSDWLFEAAEFPVALKGDGTRIDFVLRHGQAPVYLLAECKRSNPTLSDWCFARAPYVRRNRSREWILLERAEGDGDDFFRASAQKGSELDDAYHIALEVACDVRGDPRSSGRGAVEEAATQICRGLNGMVEFLAGHPAPLLECGSALFLPVIFTTARLWVSNADLAATDLRTGKIDPSKSMLTRADWLFYQYHQSPGIKHSRSPQVFPEALGELLDAEYIRSIAVVSATGAEGFLKWSSCLDNFLLP